MQINKLSKCVTTVLLMCCYLSRKRVIQPRFQSYQLAYQLMLEKVKHITKVAIYMRKVRMRYRCKLPSTTLVFLLKYQKALKVHLVLVGTHRKESLARVKLPIG